ncbi:SAGA complex subunit Sgf73 [Polyrhizophydium stewartii]|uniref:SAGA complex subunit Sgf73 n=1 Tax=Polyrhizophydium stewartii TaxID=2732419 RepID=A0ABR4MXK3_9FUNG
MSSKPNKLPKSSSASSLVSKKRKPPQTMPASMSTASTAFPTTIAALPQAQAQAQTQAHLQAAQQTQPPAGSPGTIALQGHAHVAPPIATQAAFTPASSLAHFAAPSIPHQMPAVQTLAAMAPPPPMAPSASASSHTMPSPVPAPATPRQEAAHPSQPLTPRANRGEAAKDKKIKGGPVNFDSQCGVMLDNGTPCARSITCKIHSVSSKRAVAGRSLPYDTLYQEHQTRSMLSRGNKERTAIAAKSIPRPAAAAPSVAEKINQEEEVSRVLAALRSFAPTSLVPTSQSCSSLGSWAQYKRRMAMADVFRDRDAAASTSGAAAGMAAPPGTLLGTPGFRS